MKKKEALELCRHYAKASKRAYQQGMTFVPHLPREVDKVCRIVITMSYAPDYVKKFAYERLGGDWEGGFLPDVSDTVL